MKFFLITDIINTVYYNIVVKKRFDATYRIICLTLCETSSLMTSLG